MFAKEKGSYLERDGGIFLGCFNRGGGEEERGDYCRESKLMNQVLELILKSIAKESFQGHWVGPVSHGDSAEQDWEHNRALK